MLLPKDEGRSTHEAMGAQMPFDGERLIYGSLSPSSRKARAGRWLADGYLVAVPRQQEAYRDMAAKSAAVLQDERRASSTRAMTCPTEKSPTSRAR